MRAISVGRAVLAGVLLVRPGRVASLASFGGRRPATWLIRVLGARMLAQSALELAEPSRRVIRLGAVVDATHAVSMLAAAARWPRYRRAALTSAGLAGASAVLAGSASGSASRTGRAS
jgi:hypothetical protein